MDFSLNVCYNWLLIFTFMTSQASFYLLFGPTRKFNNLVNNPVQNGGVFQFSLYPDLDLFFYQNTSYYRLKRVRFSRTANSWTPKAKLIRLIEIFLDTWLIYHSSYKPLKCSWLGYTSHPNNLSCFMSLEFKRLVNIFSVMSTFKNACTVYQKVLKPLKGHLVCCICNNQYCPVLMERTNIYMYFQKHNID